MQYTRKCNLIGWVLAWALVPAGSALADGVPPLTKEAYKAEKERVEQQAKAQRKACGARNGLAKDLCQAEVKGWERTTLAQLEAELEPSPEADKAAKLVRADAEYDVAKLRCAPLQRKARDQCVKQAKGAREAAIRLAKVEKVEEIKQKQRAQAAEKRQEASKPPNS